MRHFLTLLALLAAPAFADTPRPDTIDDTLRLLRDAIAAAPGISDARIDHADRSVRYTDSDGEEGRAFPDNLHILLQQAETEDERAAILSRHAALAPLPDLDMATILPVLRPADFGAGVEDGPDLITRAFHPEITVFYVQDLPTRIAYPERETLMGVVDSTDALHDLALENLRRLSADKLTIEGGPYLYLVTLDGSYESSLLLDDQLWTSLGGQIGRITAMVPARDILLIADADVPRAVTEMQALVARNIDGLSHRISDRVLEWTGTGWRPYQP